MVEFSPHFTRQQNTKPDLAKTYRQFLPIKNYEIAISFIFVSVRSTLADAPTSLLDKRLTIIFRRPLYGRVSKQISKIFIITIVATVSGIHEQRYSDKK